MGLFNWFAKRAARKAFALCDINGDGRLQIAEVRLCATVTQNFDISALGSLPSG